jgi:hypothetical protein
MGKSPPSHQDTGDESMKNITHRCRIGTGASDRAAPGQILDDPDPLKIMAPSGKSSVWGHPIRARLHPNSPTSAFKSKSLFALTLWVNL